MFFAVFVQSDEVLLCYFPLFSFLSPIKILVETYNLLLQSEPAEESPLVSMVYSYPYSQKISSMHSAVLVQIFLLVLCLFLLERSDHQNPSVSVFVLFSLLVPQEALEMPVMVSVFQIANPEYASIVSFSVLFLYPLWTPLLLFVSSSLVVLLYLLHILLL